MHSFWLTPRIFQINQFIKNLASYLAKPLVTVLHDQWGRQAVDCIGAWACYLEACLRYPTQRRSVPRSFSSPYLDCILSVS